MQITKEKPNWIKCTGEAHRPEVQGMIDNCMVCMPFWEMIPVCPDCNKRLTTEGVCRVCKAKFEVD